MVAESTPLIKVLDVLREKKEYLPSSRIHSPLHIFVSLHVKTGLSGMPLWQVEPGGVKKRTGFCRGCLAD
jgi:hypothetical protein